MIDISVRNLVKSFEVGNNLLDGLSFEINDGERVGILGRNGCGKTTLFRILTKEIGYDEGEIMIAPGKRMGLMSQIPVYPPHYTTEDVLKEAHRPLYELQRKIEELAIRMADDHSDAVMREYDRLTNLFESRGGYNMDVDRAKVANGLEISHAMREQLFASLSGGEKTRVNLARLILEDTDILLLDEPTNHLDLHATEWLEEYLSKFRGTVLAISHDRYFLDRVIQRAVEIQDGKAEFYSGNYSFYAIEKMRRYEERMRQYEKEQAKIAQLEKSAEQLRIWAFSGMDKTFKRAKSMEKRIARLQTIDKPRTEKKLKVKFSEREFHGDEVLVLEGVGKSFGERTLFSDIELLVTGGERIGIIGDNGTGKSTLVKMIVQEEFADKGRIHFGPTVKCAYLPQVVEFDHPERNLYDTMLYSEKCTPQQARDRLAAFGFTGEDVFKPVSALSGGERSRLRLCMLMRDEINLLILDEPTNHLDIASREWIEDAVEEYQGALIFVSHDRYFIQEFANRIWSIDDGKLTDFEGNFNAFKEYKARQESLQQTAKAVEKKKEKAPKKKNSGSREKLLAKLERDIQKAEDAVAEIDSLMEQYSSDYTKLMELGQQKEAAEAALEELFEQWEELADE